MKLGLDDQTPLFTRLEQRKWKHFTSNDLFKFFLSQLVFQNIITPQLRIETMKPSTNTKIEVQMNYNFYRMYIGIYILIKLCRFFCIISRLF